MKTVRLYLNLSLLVVTFLSGAPVRGAGKYDAFQTACDTHRGSFKGNASGYLFPGESSSAVGVARCAILTTTNSYSDTRLVRSTPILTFDPKIIQEFQNSCPGSIYLAAMPDLGGSLSWMGSSIESQGYIVFVCK